MLLKAASLAKSVFYYHQHASGRADKNAVLKVLIAEKHNPIKNVFVGYRTVTLALRRDGLTINAKKVYRCMRELGLAGKRKGKTKRYSSFSKNSANKAPNILEQDFAAMSPGKKLSTDITEMKVGKQKLYFSPLIDLHNSEVLSFSLGLSPNMHLISNMLNQKIKNQLKKYKGAILHTDQGCQYQHRQYTNQLKDLGIARSMSRKGNCYDNAQIESFFSTFKHELYYTKKWECVAQLTQAITRYISYYNNDRIIHRLKMSPTEYRKERAIRA